MPAPVRSALQRALHAVREFTVAQRTLALIGLAVLVVGAIAVGTWLTRPQYAPLYSGLSGSDASAIVDQLQADGVPYELTDGGTTIMVPQEQVAAERIAAAASGLPSSDSGGYSLLDSMGVTASEFQQNVTYKRALEGELATTLQGLTGVSTASVQLAIPEQSVFAEEQPKTTAAVFLEVQSGTTLSPEQIVSVQHLVSSAVPGLQVEDVSVVDADGTLLSATGASSADRAQSDYEEGVRSQVQAMLDRIVGAGHASVAVTAQIQTESAQQTSETFTAPEEGGLALSESTSSEVYGANAASGTTGGAGATGVLGPDNIAVPNGTDGGTSTTSENGYSSTSTDRVNAINKVTEVRTIPAGALIRQSLSIAVDESVDGVDVAALERLVAAAAGIDEERGDTISVEQVAFAVAGSDAAAVALEDSRTAQEQAAMNELIQTGIIAGAVALVLIVLILAIARGRKRAGSSSIDVGDLPVSPVGGSRLDAVDDQPAVSGFAAAPQVTASDPVAPIGLADTELTRARAVVESLARTDPERTADYLRRLMDEPAGAGR